MNPELCAVVLGAFYLLDHLLAVVLHYVSQDTALTFHFCVKNALWYDLITHCDLHCSEYAQNPHHVLFFIKN